MSAIFTKKSERIASNGSQANIPRFVLQISGNQEIRFQTADNLEEIRLNLNSGDILFLPPGQSTFSRSVEMHSLQLSINFLPLQRYRGISSLSWLNEALRADKSLHQTFPMILEDMSTHEDFLKAVDSAKQNYLNFSKRQIL